MTETRRNPLTWLALIALTDRLPLLRPFVARLLGRLRRGHALGSHGLPRHRPDPEEGLDVAGRPAGDVVLGGDRGEPALPRPLDRLDPPHDARRPRAGLRLRVERPCLLRRRRRPGRGGRADLEVVAVET